MSRLLFHRRPVAAVLVVLQLGGCTSWHVETLPPAGVISQRHPDRLLAYGFQGKSEMFYGPEVNGDSLRGRWSASSTDGIRAVSLASVRSVSTARISTFKTLGLSVVLAAAALGLAEMIAFANVASDWSQ